MIESFIPEVGSIDRAAAGRSPESSRDAVASDGLAFLRDLFGEQ